MGGEEKRRKESKEESVGAHCSLLSRPSTGDDLSLLPFCKEPAPPSEGEGLSLDHMSVSEGRGCYCVRVLCVCGGCV